MRDEDRMRMRMRMDLTVLTLIPAVARFAEARAEYLDHMKTAPRLLPMVLESLFSGSAWHYIGNGDAMLARCSEQR